jgi:hypothetical protein
LSLKFIGNFAFIFIKIFPLKINVNQQGLFPISWGKAERTFKIFNRGFTKVLASQRQFSPRVAGSHPISQSLGEKRQDSEEEQICLNIAS